MKLEAGLEELHKLPRESTLDAEVRQRLVQQQTASPQGTLSISVASVSSATPGQDLRIAAIVEAEPGLQSIRLRYRHMTQFEDYEAVDMVLDSTTGKYEATIPGSFIASQWDLMFYVEAISSNGQGRMAPDLEKGMPYAIVPVAR